MRVRERRRPSGILLLVLAVMALPTLALQVPIVGARAYLGADDTKHAVHLASPAVVRIIANAAGTVICRSCNAGATVSLDEDYVYSGSGTFVSPDGYILTADHVVDSAYMKQDLISHAIDDYAQRTNETTDQANAVFQQASNTGRLDTSSLRVKSERVFLSTSYTGTLTKQSQLKSFAIDTIAAQSPVNQQDTAILKINVHDMPFLTLAPKSAVNVQDTVTAVAYPGDADTADFRSLLTPSSTDANSLTSLLTPTIETGSIIKQDTLDDGSTAYETTDISFHGSSGGAVINAGGQTVGFVDRFTSDPSSTRVTILYSSDTASHYTKKAGIPAAPSGAFMTSWTRAINDYDATTSCHFTTASDELTALHNAYPQFGGVQPYLDDASAKATPATCATTSSGGSAAGLIALIVIVVILVLAVIGLYFLLAQRRKQVTPAITAPGGYSMLTGPTGPGAAPPFAAPSTGYPQRPAYSPTQSPSPTAAPAPLTPHMQPQPQQNVQQPPMPPTIRRAGPMLPPQEQPGGPEARTVLAPRPNLGQLSPTGPQNPQSGAPALRRCVNGHLVNQDGALHCPVCGAPL